MKKWIEMAAGVLLGVAVSVSAIQIINKCLSEDVTIEVVEEKPVAQRNGAYYYMKALIRAKKAAEFGIQARTYDAGGKVIEEQDHTYSCDKQWIWVEEYMVRSPDGTIPSRGELILKVRQ